MILVALGNICRRDDGVGPILLRRFEDCETHYCRGDPLGLMAALEGRDAAILIDAMEGTQAGKIHRWVWGKTPPERFSARLSSHSLELLSVLQLMENLGKLPRFVTIFAVEGTDFSWGEGLSKEVDSAVSKLENAIRNEIAVARTHA